ncbi:MAG TPA: AMP-binding protein [Polyangiaceae bacterium]|nr:AMP-binding protein [Polyangiaceae bacterium]
MRSPRDASRDRPLLALVFGDREPVFNIGAAVTSRHAGTPVYFRTAFVVDGPLGAHEYTYADLTELCARFQAFLSDSGMSKEARVLIRLPDSIEFPIAFFGTMRAGRVAVPTSTSLSASELALIAKDSGAEILVTTREDWAHLAPTVSEAPALRVVLLVGGGELSITTTGLLCIDFGEALGSSDANARAINTAPEDPAYLVYTSANTNLPARTLHTHRALIERQPARKNRFDFGGHVTIQHSGCIGFTDALETKLIDPLYRGHTVVVRRHARSEMSERRSSHADSPEACMPRPFARKDGH